MNIIEFNVIHEKCGKEFTVILPNPALSVGEVSALVQVALQIHVGQCKNR